MKLATNWSWNSRNASNSGALVISVAAEINVQAMLIHAGEPTAPPSAAAC